MPPGRGGVLFQVLLGFILCWRGHGGLPVWENDALEVNPSSWVDVLDVGEMRLLGEEECGSVGVSNSFLGGEGLWLVEISWILQAPSLAELEEVELEVSVEVNSSWVHHTLTRLPVGHVTVTEVCLPRYGKHWLRLMVSALTQTAITRVFVLRPHCDISSHKVFGEWEEFISSYERYQEDVLSALCPPRFFVHHVDDRRGMGNQMMAIASSFLAALLSNRVFVLDWNKPISITTFLVPKSFNWDLSHIQQRFAGFENLLRERFSSCDKDSSPEFASAIVDHSPAQLCPLCPCLFSVGRQISPLFNSLERAFAEPRFYYWLGILTNTLFSPSEQLKEDLSAWSSVLRSCNHTVGVQIRRAPPGLGNLPFLDDQGERTALECARQLEIEGHTCFVVISDDVSVRERAASALGRGKTIVSGTTPFPSGLDHGASAHRAEVGVRDAMVDFMVLGELDDCVLSEDSSFGYAAFARSMLLPVTVSNHDHLLAMPCQRRVWHISNRTNMAEWSFPVHPGRKASPRFRRKLGHALSRTPMIPPEWARVPLWGCGMGASSVRQRVFDAFLFNGEFELLEARLHELGGHVERFVIVESRVFFSTRPKPPQLLLANNLQHLQPWLRLLHLVSLTEAELPDCSEKWACESFARNALHHAVIEAGATAHDIIIVSDADEIPRAVAVDHLRRCSLPLPLVLEARQFYWYSAHWRMRKPWLQGPHAMLLLHLAERSPQQIRMEYRTWSRPDLLILPDAAFHFSYFFDGPGLVQKIQAFSHVELDRHPYNSTGWMLSRAAQGRDYLDREVMSTDYVSAISYPNVPWYVCTHSGRVPSFFRYSRDGVDRQDCVSDQIMHGLNEAKWASEDVFPEVWTAAWRQNEDEGTGAFAEARSTIDCGSVFSDEEMQQSLLQLDAARRTLSLAEMADCLRLSKNKISMLSPVNPVFLVDPRALITADRFDLMAKLIFAQNYVSGAGAAQWGARIYGAHIQALNNFSEHDFPSAKKEKLPDFVNHFEQVLRECTERAHLNSTSLVPVHEIWNGRQRLQPLESGSSNNAAVSLSIVDGAHRTAAALVLELPLPALQIRNAETELESGWTAMDSKYLLSRGLARVYTDAMAIEWFRWRPDSTLFVFWPAALLASPNLSAALDVMKEHGDVVYERHVEIDVRSNAPLLLILTAHLAVPWIGSADDRYAGASAKAARCFPARDTPASLLVVVFAPRLHTFHRREPRPSLGAKNAIYDMFRGRISDVEDAVHCADGQDEAERLVSLLFSANGRLYLSRADLFRVPDWLDRNLEVTNKVKQWAARRGIPLEGLCVVGQSVLQLYGVQESNSVDLIVNTVMAPPAARWIEQDKPIWGISSKTHHFADAQEIITDPERHLSFLGVKFFVDTDLNSEGARDDTLQEIVRDNLVSPIAQDELGPSPSHHRAMAAAAVPCFEVQSPNPIGDPTRLELREGGYSPSLLRLNLVHRCLQSQAEFEGVCDDWQLALAFSNRRDSTVKILLCECLMTAQRASCLIQIPPEAVPSQPCTRSVLATVSAWNEGRQTWHASLEATIALQFETLVNEPAGPSSLRVRIGRVVLVQREAAACSQCSMLFVEVELPYNFLGDGQASSVRVSVDGEGLADTKGRWHGVHRAGFKFVFAVELTRRANSMTAVVAAPDGETVSMAQCDIPAVASLADGGEVHGGRSKLRSAIAMLVTSLDYLPGVLALIHSIRRTCITQRDYALVVMTTEKLGDDVMHLINVTGAEVRRVPRTSLPPTRRVQAGDRFLHTASKIHAWSLLHYDQVMILDADMVVMECPLYVLQLQREANASFMSGSLQGIPRENLGVWHDCSPYQFMNAVMVLHPDAAMHASLLAALEQSFSNDGADAGFFATVLCGSDHHYSISPFTFAWKRFARPYVEALGAAAFTGIDFSGLPKPWQLEPKRLLEPDPGDGQNYSAVYSLWFAEHRAMTQSLMTHSIQSLDVYRRFLLEHAPNLQVERPRGETPIRRHSDASDAYTPSASLEHADAALSLDQATLGSERELYTTRKGLHWQPLIVAGGPSPRAHHAMAEWDGSLFVFGGCASPGRSTTSNQEVNDLYQYEVAAHMWHQLYEVGSGNLPAARCVHAMAAHNGRLFVFGGSQQPDGAFFNDLHQYSIKGKTWTDLGPQSSGEPPAPRHGHTMAACTGSLFVFGGRDGAGVQLGDLLEYDIAGRAWRALTSLSSGPAPEPLRYAAMGATGGSIFLFGGYWRKIGPVATLHEYQVASKRWSDRSGNGTDVHPLARCHHAMAAVEGFLFVFGGKGPASRRLDDVWSYEIASQTWHAELAPAAPARLGHIMTASGSRLFSLGGSVLLASLEFSNDLFMADTRNRLLSKQRSLDQ